MFHGYKNITGIKNPVIAIGIFDGLHLGHKKVISKILSYKKQGSDSVIITFDPHPRNVLSKSKVSPRIMSLKHRLQILDKMGIDAVIVIKFTTFLAKMSPEDFVKRVLIPLSTKKVYIGENFKFGHNKQGDVAFFNEIGKHYGIKIYKVSPAKKYKKEISSTWLRALIGSGKLKKARVLLNRPVSILGTVVHGDSRGKKLGFPTANLDPHQEVIPPAGVYAAKININEKFYDAVVNIGFRPTFYGIKHKREEPNIETHIFNFSKKLYGKNIEIFFITKLRDEKKFADKELLIRQIKKDITRAKKILTRSG
ncbi:riboflavin biosynthesis protein RibF [Candidatus Omnitrophus magneticus]|uniref:Riboflavin biosynthesis protein n=1 Tax=Candidatus Omnitrophus magneticus TaxID=1609969 RepID=A0A0F0CL39_9BACT|nr:riboflavin biosynthesis protein RibF [Candidatus Omnitrophus magneticus]